MFGIQMLRGVAALSVVIHHTLEESSGAKSIWSPDWFTTAGAAGVDIFFVISGFIMLHTTFRSGQKPLSPGTFLLRRGLRIYPLYWVCCAAMVALILIGFMRHHQIGLRDLLLSIVFLPSPTLLIGVSWTLVFEICFYILFAGSLLLRSRRMSAAATTVAIGGGVLATSQLGPSAIAWFAPNPIPIEFTFGLWIALWRSRATEAGRPWPISAVWAAPAFVALALVPLVVAHPTTNGLSGWPRVIAWGLPSALIVAAFANLGAPADRFGRGLVFLGDASYALYLTHPFVMIGYGFLLRNPVVSAAPQAAIAPLVMLLAVAVGVWAHATIEKPLMALVKRTTRRLTTV